MSPLLYPDAGGPAPAHVAAGAPAQLSLAGAEGEGAGLRVCLNLVWYPGSPPTRLAVQDHALPFLICGWGGGAPKRADTLLVLILPGAPRRGPPPELLFPGEEFERLQVQLGLGRHRLASHLTSPGLGLLSKKQQGCRAGAKGKRYKPLSAGPGRCTP